MEERWLNSGRSVYDSAVIEGVASLVKASNVEKSSGVVRDRDYLDWRLRRPGNSYRCFESRDTSGTLRAAVISELLPKHGCVVGYVMGIFADDGSDSYARHALRLAEDAMRAAGADLALAWSTPLTWDHRILRRSHFLPLPPRVSPVELHWGYRSLNDVGLFERQEVQLSYLDSDTV